MTKENHKLAKDADAAKLEVMQLRDLRLGKTTSAKAVEKQAAQRQAALLKEAETLEMEHQREVIPFPVSPINSLVPVGLESTWTSQTGCLEQARPPFVSGGAELSTPLKPLSLNDLALS